MSFLVPLFLLGLAAVAIPVLVHLTRKQRKGVVSFPSLMFLEKIPFQEQRRRRIRNWLLLALRAGAVALLALAFARPFFAEEDAAGMAAGGPREVVVLLDRSYSMEVEDQFRRGVDAAREALDGLGPLDRASLVVFDQGATVTARSTADRLLLRAALDTVAPGSGGTRYGPALKAAQTILEESELPRGEVVLVTDFQSRGWTGDEGVRLPAGATLRAVDVAAPPGENVQVADVSLVREAVGTRERVTVTARVARRGGASPGPVPVTLELDGQEARTRTVELGANDAATVTFEPFVLSQAHTRGAVRVPADGLPADDARHFVLSPGNALDVLVLRGAAAQEEASLYFSRALEISEEGRFRTRVRRSDQVRPADLEQADAVVLADVRLDGASAERLRSFVEEGGGVLVALGETASWPASAEDLLPGRAGGPVDRGEAQGGRLGFLAYDHPVFEVFAGPRSGDFTGARFYRARDFRPADSARVLARFDDGSPALVERGRGRGRILVWTSSLDAYWNDLALQPVYLPFVHRLTEYLAGRAEALPWFDVGQVVDLADPQALERLGVADPAEVALGAGEEAVALTPSGGSLELAAREDGSRYLPLEERGFYTVRPPGVEPDRPLVLAVNPDLEESGVDRLDPEELAAEITRPGGGGGSGPGLGEAAAMAREDRERRQSLWRWLLLGAFGLLAVESAASNWLSRRPSGTPGVAAGRT